jgi:hypothetical protein
MRKPAYQSAGENYRLLPRGRKRTLDDTMPASAILTAPLISAGLWNSLIAPK